ncbi:MAG: DUF4921 family protein [Planctomycetota bacterium]
MSELREDPLTGRRVIIAENRSGRPNEYSPAVDSEADDTTPREDCVFCPGNEARTPHATHETIDADGAWQTRTIPNKYPAIDPVARQGVHEVVIESRRHLQRTGQLSVAEFARVLLVYAERMAELAADAGLPYRLLFKNVGASAGASLHHLHSQLIALPSVPPHIEAEQARLAAYRQQQQGACGWCDRIAAVRQDRDRVVGDWDEWLAFCPSASRQPYETWLLPTEHTPRFESLADSPAAAETLARQLLPLIRAIESQIVPHGYNLIIHTTPGGVLASGGEPGEGHWRMEIVPRVASLAGLELATGLFMNVLSPERAAANLRRQIGSFRSE